MNQQEYDGFLDYKRRKAKYTLVVLAVFGLWWGGTELNAHFKTAAVGKAIQKEKIERITKIIDQPDEHSFLRMATKKEIIILQASSSSKDSVSFVMGKPIKPSLHIYEHMEKLDLYKATSMPYRRIKVAKEDLKKALAMEDDIKSRRNRFMLIPTIHPADPVSLVDGILFNGIYFRSNGYSFAHDGKPANLTLTNKGLPFTIDAMKSVEGELMGNRKFPTYLDHHKVLGVNIKPPKEGMDQTWAFDMFMTSELGTKHQYRVERVNKENKIYEIK